MDLLNAITTVASIGACYLAYITYQKLLYPDGLKTFEQYLKDYENWQSEHSENLEIWRYLRNTDYEFHVRFVQKWESTESWIPKFPDTNKGKEEVVLLVKGKRFSTPILFISLESGKYMLPVPEMGPNGEYLWRKDNIALKLDRIIGKYPGGVYPGDLPAFSVQYNIPII